ncbi:putative G-protein coupled receptor Mth-like 6, partial [Stegodyphus mimosarum]
MSRIIIILNLIFQFSMTFAAYQNNSFIRRVIRSAPKSSKYIYTESRRLTTQQTDVDICRRYTFEETLAPVQTVYRKRFVNKRSWITTTTTSPDTDIDLSRFSEEFLNCSHMMVDQECYEILANGSVYVPVYLTIFNETDYVIGKTGILFICPDFFPTVVKNTKFSIGLGLITVIGLGISTVFIILHIIMFMCLKKLRNLPGYCLLSLCIALLMAYTGSFLQYGLAGRTECSWVGMIMFYFYLASFFWMNIISYNVWRSMRMVTSKLQLTTDNPMGLRFALYSIFSWGSPLLILLIAFIVDRTTENP